MASIYPPWNAPFAEQVAFFKQKLNLPTERWNDIFKAAHDKAFMVAGAQSADLLNDLHSSIAKAIELGTGLGQFRKDFRQIVAKHGWANWTGSESAARTAWRTKVIYQTNMSTSYAAGRWAQLNDPDLLKSRPYWQYKHSDSVTFPRPLHVSWNGLTLPHDHVFWRTHFPPNGWGCQCRIIAVPKSVFLKAITQGRGPANVPDLGTVDGIDEGFDYAPGSSVDLSLRQVVQDKLISYPPAISRALSKDINRRINAEDSVIAFVNKALADTKLIETHWLGFVEQDEVLSKALNHDVKGFLVLTKSEAVRHVRNSHGDDKGEQRPPTPEDYLHLLDMVNAPDSLRLGDETRNGLPTLVVWKNYGGETFRAVFEMRPGNKNRAFLLLSFLIKV